MQLARNRGPVSCGTVLAVAIVSAACASSGAVGVTVPAPALSGYDTVRVSVWTDVAGGDKEAIQLEATVASFARGSRLPRRS
jgi:hypothetical protein